MDRNSGPRHCPEPAGWGAGRTRAGPWIEPGLIPPGCGRWPFGVLPSPSGGGRSHHPANCPHRDCSSPGGVPGPPDCQNHPPRLSFLISSAYRCCLGKREEGPTCPDLLLSAGAQASLPASPLPPSPPHAQGPSPPLASETLPSCVASSRLTPILDVTETFLRGKSHPS